MSKDNLAVSLVHEICPICGRPMNETIIMNKELTPKYAKQVEEINGKAIGFSKEACEECTKHKDECIYVIGIDPAKGDSKSMTNIYRSGHLVGVRKDFQLFVEHPEFILKTNNNVQFCFIDERFGKEIGFFK